jgi:tripartite-type tricarboxylate transporter receptor subunit TctC
MKHVVHAALAAALAVLAAVPQAVAQYPSKPIRIVVPFAPGGNVDITARTLAPALQEALGQPVVVENRPGAGGKVGAQAVHQAGPDGYTLMMGSNSTLSVGPALYPDWPYDAQKGVAPISNLAVVPFVLVVKTALPAQSVADVIRMAKDKPGQVTMASGGPGSSNHLVGELFQMQAGVQMNHIPYKGAGAAMTDLIGGQVDLLFDQASSTVANIKSGKIRALAVAAKARQAALPDTPTFAEAGVKDFMIDNFTGLVAPAGVPADAIAKLHAAAVKALATPAVKERFAQLGIQPVGNTPEQFAAEIREDLARWQKVVKAAGVKVQ